MLNLNVSQIDEKQEFEGGRLIHVEDPLLEAVLNEQGS
jgi:hypothetical protein